MTKKKKLSLGERSKRQNAAIKRALLDSSIKESPIEKRLAQNSTPAKALLPNKTAVVSLTSAAKHADTSPGLELCLTQSLQPLAEGVKDSGGDQKHEKRQYE